MNVIRKIFGHSVPQMENPNEEGQTALKGLVSNRKICPMCGYQNPLYRVRCKNCDKPLPAVPQDVCANPRDVCAKCGITLEERVKWWRTPSRPGAVRIGNEGGLFLWCDHCQKAICGGCSVDLGMSCGCPFCENEIKEFGDKQVKALLLSKGNK